MLTFNSNMTPRSNIIIRIKSKRFEKIWLENQDIIEEVKGSSVKDIQDTIDNLDFTLHHLWESGKKKSVIIPQSQGVSKQAQNGASLQH